VTFCKWTPTANTTWIKIAASALLRLFININEKCHFTDAPSTYAKRFFKCSQIWSMIPEDQKNITSQWCSTGRHFTAATQALNTSCNSTEKRESPNEAYSAWGKITSSILFRLVMKYVTTLTPPIANERNTFSNINNKQLMLHDAGCVSWGLSLFLSWIKFTTSGV